jgi:hypothetical protein
LAGAIAGGQLELVKFMIRHGGLLQHPSKSNMMVFKEKEVVPDRRGSARLGAPIIFSLPRYGDMVMGNTWLDLSPLPVYVKAEQLYLKFAEEKGNTDITMYIIKHMIRMKQSNAARPA